MAQKTRTRSHSSNPFSGFARRRISRKHARAKYSIPNGALHYKPDGIYKPHEFTQRNLSKVDWVVKDGGRFYVIYKAGQSYNGNFTTVHKAHEILKDGSEKKGHVVIKLIRSFHKDPTAVEAEAYALNEFKRLPSSPSKKNLYQVRSDSETGNMTYAIVMKAIPGENLSSFLKTNKNLDKLTLITIMQGMAKCLQEFHEKSFLHRDIKPANFMLGAGHKVALTDFGSAKEAKGGTFNGTTEGTTKDFWPEDFYTVDAVTNKRKDKEEITFSESTDIHALLVSYKCLLDTQGTERQDLSELRALIESMIGAKLDQKPKLGEIITRLINPGRHSTLALPATSSQSSISSLSSPSGSDLLSPSSSTSIMTRSLSSFSPMSPLLSHSSTDVTSKPTQSQDVKLSSYHRLLRFLGYSQSNPPQPAMQTDTITHSPNQGFLFRILRFFRGTPQSSASNHQIHTSRSFSA